jgi:N-acetylglucosaminyl-diphospho-decaprenol L-rhamnosyltransferase
VAGGVGNGGDGPDCIESADKKGSAVSASFDIAVIVVGLNASNYVRECCESLHAADWQSYSHEVIYVDNGSTDDTLAMLEDRFSEVQVLANPTNVGFSKAANQGARVARSRYLFFLNDDTLVLDGAIAAMVAHADLYPDVGALGGRLLNTDLTEQYSGRRFPSPSNAVFGRRSVLTKFFPNTPAVSAYLYKEDLVRGEAFEADWVSAAAVLFPQRVFHRIGGFAEDYYYWHEVIFCDRVRKLGYRVELLPAAKIIHHEGKGSGVRSFKSQRFHILNFHAGGYRCYCEHHELPPLHPVRIVVAGMLFTRATVLLGAAGLRSLSSLKTLTAPVRRV